MLTDKKMQKKVNLKKCVCAWNKDFDKQWLQMSERELDNLFSHNVFFASGTEGTVASTRSEDKCSVQRYLIPPEDRHFHEIFHKEGE